jgi:hypothetical protein
MSLGNITDQINADVENDLSRLRKRGIETGDKLIEAFVSEHRGTQYINAQMLSCRVALDVSMPYVESTLLGLATRIALATKFGNAINRAVLQNHAPELLRFPSAATLLPAGYPILLQESVRACRRVLDKTKWSLYFASNGRVAQGHFGWPNFEFLRHSDELRTIVSDLKCDIWDKKALDRTLIDAAKFGAHARMSTVRQSLLRIYSTDLMLRS